jgi:hypothetical protein
MTNATSPVETGLTAMDWGTAIAGAAMIAVVGGITLAALIWALSMMMGLPDIVMFGLQGLCAIGAVAIGVWATRQGLEYQRKHH